MKYSDSLWTRSKQGAIDGFRSSVTLVSELKLGVFTSAFRSNVPEKTVWTLPIVSMLAPAVASMLWAQPAPPLPPNWRKYVGRYTSNCSLYVTNKTGSPVLQGLFFGTTKLNFTVIVDENTGKPVEHVLRGHSVLDPGCKFLDDGDDLENIYFKVDGNSSATSFNFMSLTAQRLPEEKEKGNKIKRG